MIDCKWTNDGERLIFFLSPSVRGQCYCHLCITLTTKSISLIHSFRPLLLLFWIPQTIQSPVLIRSCNIHYPPLSLIMSKKRPGVPAAVNLMRALEQERSTNCSNDALWNHVNAQETTLIQDIPHLEKHQQALDLLRDKLTTEKEPELSVADLETVLNWKHTVGKNRPFNVKLVRSNNTPTVQHHSRIALKSAKSLISDVEDETSSWEAPLKELVKLKGVGPATASAILCLVRPDVYGYMYDEAIDCVEKTRYRRINRLLTGSIKCLTSHLSFIVLHQELHGTSLQPCQSAMPPNSHHQWQTSGGSVKDSVDRRALHGTLPKGFDKGCDRGPDRR